jgi:tRNA nucleotidyltransferase (CCA-adding enzyme)
VCVVLDCSKISKSITGNVYSIIESLWEDGYQAYIVGGACRDSILNTPVKDFDIVTSATPDDVCEIFPEAKKVSKSFPVTLVDGIEVATYRKDLGDFAEPVRNVEGDLSRRDFTINSIIYCVYDKTYYDYFGGISDLEDRLLRFIGNPCRRIKEDPIRILRGLRFASKYNLNIEKETFFSICKHKRLLKDIPKERIQVEIEKAFSHNNTHRFLTLCRETGVLELLFPSINALEGIEGGWYHDESVLDHCFNAVKAIEDKKWELKLTALYHDVGKCSPKLNDLGFNTFRGHDKIGEKLVLKDLKQYLKFPNSVVNYVKCLVGNHMSSVNSGGDKCIRKLYNNLYEYSIPLKDFIYLRYADNKGNIKSDVEFIETWKLYRKCLKALNKVEVFSVKHLKVNGSTIMSKYNLKQGRLIGVVLKNLFNKVSDGDINNTFEDCINYLDNLYDTSENFTLLKN